MSVSDADRITRGFEERPILFERIDLLEGRKLPCDLEAYEQQQRAERLEKALQHERNASELKDDRSDDLVKQLKKAKRGQRALIVVGVVLVGGAIAAGTVKR